MSPSPRGSCPSARKSGFDGRADHGCAGGKPRRAAALICPDGGQLAGAGPRGAQDDQKMIGQGSMPGKAMESALQDMWPLVPTPPQDYWEASSTAAGYRALGRYCPLNIEGWAIG